MSAERTCAREVHNITRALQDNQVNQQWMTQSASRHLCMSPENALAVGAVPSKVRTRASVGARRCTIDGVS